MSKDVETPSIPPRTRGSANARRWLPAAIVPAVVIGVAFTVPAVAGSTPNLPEKSAQDVLALIAQSGDAHYSGTVEQNSELGLPELPAMGPGSSPDSAAGSALELLSGSHTARVYVGSPDTARLQLMDTLAQRDVVINGSEAWLYSSSTKEAVHVLLPDDAGSAPDASALPPGTPTTPAELADQLIAAVEPSTNIEVGDTARVAGRAVYTLTLTPKSTGTLVDSVVLSVDADTGLPLAVSVSAAGQKAPAFSVEFSSISFDAPDAALFDFTPPADATVTEKDLTDVAENHPEIAEGTLPEGAESGAQPTVLGEGWSSILVVPAEALAAGAGAEAGAGAGAGAAGTEAPATDGSGKTDGPGADGQQLLDQLTTTVPEGRLFESALVSALFTTDGRLLVGAVSGEQLQAAANSTP